MKVGSISIQDTEPFGKKSGGKIGFQTGGLCWI